MKLAPPLPGFDLAWCGDLNADVPTHSRFAPVLDLELLAYVRDRLREL